MVETHIPDLCYREICFVSVRTHAGMSSSMSGEAAAHRASALASNTLLMKLPPASFPAILLLKPGKTNSI